MRISSSVFIKFFLILLDLLLVAVFFGIDTTAIFLHIKFLLSGFCLAFPKAGGKIVVAELHAVFLGGFFTDLTNEIVVLIRGNGQGGGKGLKALLLGGAGGLIQPHRIAIGATVLDIVADRFGEFLDAVFIVDDERKVDGFGVFNQSIAAGFIFLIGVDIGIIPKADRGDAFFGKLFQTRYRAGSATDM